ncbi:uncharacterized protein HKW66_Vig0034790 [Vigna angularis]|uniref:Uncharacterized protein n=1 Tax=Phaseolus angularis TaxID=3914 RepID=A0A8T0L968_PHAAN|nr:uncharacterized protein HKW66_Vig0034790 [Vigna angularis]
MPRERHSFFVLAYSIHLLKLKGWFESRRRPSRDRAGEPDRDFGTEVEQTEAGESRCSEGIVEVVSRGGAGSNDDGEGAEAGGGGVFDEGDAEGDKRGHNVRDGSAEEGFEVVWRRSMLLE